ncbi:hypothetical protein EWM64_g5023 [Hericium alpestre]|uniref:GST N-terminal domain-containing protein n=1 Tax=Hericium alpestre TaxID=135208 RepID=A0A4Y9ZZW4_9AGAM|nr:hypothetical protein EWM64_g5023 [Hericium alpestre]
MATVKNLTLYTAKVCPYAQRVEIAFEEAGVKPTKYQINLQDKPEWYAPNVNPASKVPAIAYGGPQVPPDQPSPESTKLAESLVLVEFVADLYPNSKLLPNDPVKRAQARFFIEFVTNKVVSPFFAFSIRGEPAEPLLAGFEALQGQLDKGTFAVSDDFTIADVALAPFLGRIELLTREDVGLFKEGEGRKVWQEIFEGPRFKRVQDYFKAVSSRPSFKATFDADFLLEGAKARYAKLGPRKQ